MAESLPESDVDELASNVSPENSLNLECAVCLQNCVHPAELPCGHVFCYLCIKGIVNRNRRCAMCRQIIPADFLDKPRLLRPVENDGESKGFDDGHSWFYEGHNGWWQYDERTSSELEAAYQSGERCCEILVAGYVYVADFDSMLQYRRNDTCKRRRIKRDLITTNKKGVAGLKISKDTTQTNSSNIVSNVLIPGMENLHISNRSADSDNQRADLARLHSITNQSSDDLEAELFFSRGHSLSPLLPAYPQGARANLGDADIDADDSLYAGNPDFSDPTAHNSLDWTLHQIESLQAQLSGDYDELDDDDPNDYEDYQYYGMAYAERLNLRGFPGPIAPLVPPFDNGLLHSPLDRLMRDIPLNRAGPPTAADVVRAVADYVPSLADFAPPAFAPAAVNVGRAASNVGRAAANVARAAADVTPAANDGATAANDGAPVAHDGATAADDGATAADADGLQQNGEPNDGDLED